jgi:hypothetical protein
LINTLEQQGYTNFVRQDYTAYLKKENDEKKTFLFSPFKAFDKAEYYCRRLKKDLLPDFFNVKNANHKKRLVEITEKSEQVCLAKIIGQNYKLGDQERYKIAAYVKKNYPEHFDLMIKNNFRLIIGDNFGEVFYKIRIGAGIIICINDSVL